MMEDGHVLTAKKVERLRIRPGRYRDGHIRGYLQVGPTGGKSWLLRFERDGRERWLGLGPPYTSSLKEARERARAARQLLARRHRSDRSPQGREGQIGGRQGQAAHLSRGRRSATSTSTKASGRTPSTGNNFSPR